MSTDKQSWLRGDLPTWIATGLIGLLCFVGVAYLNHVNKELEQVELSKGHIAIHDLEIASLKATDKDIKDVLKEIVNELKTLNSAIKK